MIKDKPNFHLSKKYRWIITFILVLTVIIGYLARMSVSVAFEPISNEMGWNTSEQGGLGGVLMGIFLVSYGFSNIFLSRYIDSYGPRIMLIFSISIWSIALVIGARFGSIYWIFIMSRLLLGIGQGVLYPTASKLTAQWYPPRERGRANSFYMSGGPLGVMLAPIIMGPIIVNASWEISFYTLAILGFAMLFPIILFLSSFPREEECEYNEEREERNNKILFLFKKRDFQVILVGFIAIASIWWGITFWIPKYLLVTQGLKFNEMTFGATFVYFGAVISMILGSWISDITGNRKKIILFSLFSTSLMIIILTTIDLHSKISTIVILFFVFFTGQLAPPLFFTMLQLKVSSNFLGSATGIMNGVGNGVSVIGPVSVGAVVAVTGSYNYGLLSLSIIGVIGGIILALNRG